VPELVEEGALVEATLVVEKPEAVGTVAAPVLDPPAAVVALEPPEEAPEPLALAAAWKAAKVFSAVGLMAKTIPA
jgi:hypothetical protein